MSALVIAAGVLYWIYYGYDNTTTIGGRSFNRGENGLWLRYLWYAGDREYWAKRDAMIESLNHGQVRYAFFHVRELKQNGQLWLRKPQSAKQLVELVHKNAPGAKAIAWVSLGAAYPAHGTDIAREDVRKTAVEEAVWLTTECGFDGVQWDFEPCRDGDPSLPLLLNETRMALSSDKILSVATPMCYALGACPTWYAWSPEYFSKVADAASSQDASNLVRVALFADYTTEESEWKEYDAYWLNQ